MVAQLQAATVRGLVIDQQHPALACREGLRSRGKLNALNAPNEPAGRPLYVAPAGLGGVLDHSDTALAAQRQDRIEIGNVAVKIDHDHRLGPRP